MRPGYETWVCDGGSRRVRTVTRVAGCVGADRLSSVSEREREWVYSAGVGKSMEGVGGALGGTGEEPQVYDTVPCMSSYTLPCGTRLQ